MAGWQPVGLGSTIEETARMSTRTFLPAGPSTTAPNSTSAPAVTIWPRTGGAGGGRAPGAWPPARPGWSASALAWQIAASILRDPVFLPSVTQTGATFLHYFNRPYPAQGSPLWYDALTSLRRILIGFGIGVGAG